MSPDVALFLFTPLGFTSIFLPLVNDITGHKPAHLVAGISNMTHTARRQAQFEQPDSIPSIAAETIEARRLGKSAAFPQDRYWTLIRADSL